LSERFDFTTSYGTAFRAPSFGAQYVKNNPAFLGNPDLDPEEIQTYQARISYNHGDLFLGEVTYYHSQLDNLIVPRRGKMGLNLGEITVNGVEIQGRYYFREFAYASAYYAMSDSDADRGAAPPRHTIGADLNLEFFENFSWNVDLYWQDELERPASDSRDSLDDYIVVNTTLLLAGFWKDHELSFSVYNLFDEGYAYPAPANTYPDDYTAPGRSFAVELRLKF
jgi:iron complex outermembrane receptor protein